MGQETFLNPESIQFHEPLESLSNKLPDLSASGIHAIYNFWEPRFDTFLALDNRVTSGTQRKTSQILAKREIFFYFRKKTKHPKLTKQHKSLGKFSKKLLPCMLKQIICMLCANSHTCAHTELWAGKYCQHSTGIQPAAKQWAPCSHECECVLRWKVLFECSLCREMAQAESSSWSAL